MAGSASRLAEWMSDHENKEALELDEDTDVVLVLV
jgi:hypothetical protein